MATELLHDLMARSSELTREEKQRLARYLSEQAKSGNGDEDTVSLEGPRTIDSRKEEGGRCQNATGLHSQKREQHLAWLKAHREEYSGRYVALNGDQLMGDGLTIKEATERAKENGCDAPFLVYVLSSEVVAEGGL
jgi:hypothetical protein